MKISANPVGILILQIYMPTLDHDDAEIRINSSVSDNSLFIADKTQDDKDINKKLEVEFRKI